MSRPTLAINAGLCSEVECDRPAHCRGVCTRHYRRLHYNEHERARRGYQPAVLTRVGDTRLNSGGYIEEKFSFGGRDWALQHRLMMSRALGRELRADENVHHINGCRTDNRIENLELWVTSQPKGQRPADLLAWAYEIIERYG